MILNFKVVDFVDETHPAYYDREGDSPWRLKIIDLPTIGTLLYNGNPLAANSTLNIADATALSYQSDEANKAAHTDTFTFQIADIGSRSFSNVGTITVNISKTHSPPTVDDNSGDLVSDTFTFSTGSFTLNFSDPDGDSYLNLIIKTLPSIGIIRLNGGLVVPGTTLGVVEANKLKYHLPDNVIVESGNLYEFTKDVQSIILEHEAAGYVLSSSQGGVLTFTKEGKSFLNKVVEGDLINNEALCFDFQVSDDSEKELLSNIAEFCLNPVGDIGTPEPYVNQPPTVEDFTIEIPFGGEYSFTVQDFLDIYMDIEGDEPDKIQILSSPGVGEISGIVLETPTEIGSISTLKYKADTTNTTGYSTSFTFKISDKGSSEYSNTGTITVIVAAKLADAPTVDDNSATLTSSTYIFNTGSFTKNFSDGDGDSYSDVTIKSLPGVPTLNLLGAPAVVGEVFEAVNSSTLRFNLDPKYAIYDGEVYKFYKSVDSIKTQYESLGYKLTDNTSGVLTFTDLDNPVDPTYVEGTLVDSSELEFTFTIKDNSNLKLESNTATFTLIPQGDINVISTYENTPPIVGDNTITINRSQIKIFGRSDFVEDTSPEYFDKEGDEPYELRINTLPSSGSLTLRGNPVVAGQVLSFTNDVETGDLKYTPDVTLTIPGVSFNFNVSDIGSKQFG